ncbi:MAG TPA: multicopper oxidase domain-containing protein [Actinomycetales bacterium]|nr:multicopper oxidase domain-containing protein [Actinomycetales bacterium]
MSDKSRRESMVSRRNVLRAGAAGAAAFGLGAGRLMLEPALSQRGFASPNGVFGAASMAWADALYTEVFPTSPLILNPFSDPLPVPKALRPVPKSVWSNWPHPPNKNVQSVDPAGNPVGTHQIWPTDIAGLPNTLPQPTAPEPIVYKIDLKVASHAFTTSQVLPIDEGGKPTVSFDATGRTYRAGTVRTLPPSTIYGFNGTFPGPMINAEYSKPALVRFENRLDENPSNLVRQDFGSPDLMFLTHLHNGHTASESDGNPHFAVAGEGGPHDKGFVPGWTVDNLYLNWPAGGDDREKQSFFWFHDHVMDSTASNVYKGMVGLYPIYDPVLDPGDETKGLRLPGVRTNNPDGSFDVKYDIPLAIFDCSLDDGVTTHHDVHDREGVFANVPNPKPHPEFWGKTFFKHFPNHGFVGDIFTVNGTAFPTLKVKRRKYRFRFLDASVSRIYEFKLMSSTKGPKAARDLGYSGEELQGQYRIPDGQQSMQFTQIATDGGLLPFPIKRDSFELWPAKRREFVVDFTRYQDDTPTTKGDVVYLTNVMKMPDGRMWSKSTRFSPDPNYKVPMLKFVIDDIAEDNSLTPATLRPLPPLPADWRTLLDNRLIFEVQRGGGGGELEWLINGVPFDPTRPATSLKNPAGNTPSASPKRGSFNLWEIRNGGGGWVHPIHMHQEEHRTVMRNGRDVSQRADAGHPDDVSREDLVALDPSESTILYRGFRDFLGPYVAHCHNLTHEDHAMMFGWDIVP